MNKSIFKIITLYLALLMPCSSFSQDSTFKVITYNIWNGFDWGNDTLRRVELQNWVHSQKPDVIALQELCGYNQKKLEEDARSWGHNYSILLKESGYSVGITSKYPIKLKEKIFGKLHHGALHCKINGIDFLVVHLHPGSIMRRREELKILQSKLEEISSGTNNYMVLGDFNAHSPFDQHLYDPNGTLLTRLKKVNEGKKLSGNIDNGELDYAVISGFLSLPLYDVVKNYTSTLAERGSFPGRVLGSVNNETTEQLISRLERIDYILVSSEWATCCINARVCNGKENWFLSDHYPVVAEFRLSK